MKPTTTKRIQLLVIFFLFAGWQIAHAIVLPKEKSVLHSGTVYFEENTSEKKGVYKLKVFASSAKVKSDSAFISKECLLPSYSCSGFNWGATYFWRVDVINKKGAVIQVGTLHSFSLVEEFSSPYFDSTKIDVLTNKPNLHANGYLVIDYLRGIFDRQGKLVWKLPNIDGLIDASAEVRDLKFTKNNTITLFTNSRPIEIDLHGNVVWSLPSPFVFMGDTVAFHHDFEKTNHDTYLLVANHKAMRKITGIDVEEFKRSQRIYEERNGELFTPIDVAIILEIDLQGNVVWWWDSNLFLDDIDLNSRKRPDGLPQMQTHANAVDINAENTKVFVGFRDISRVLVIDKKTKLVDISYGEKYPSGKAKWGNGLFKQQHDAKPTARNSFFIFNNNGPKGNFGISSIIELTADSTKASDPVMWSFNLDFDTLTKGRSGSGGNVNELPNGNIFLCAGQLNRIFEVTRQKEIVWDAFVYALQKSDNKWHAMPNYRASWVEEVRSHQLFTTISQKKKSKSGQLQVQLSVFNPLAPNDDYEISAQNASTGELLICEQILITSQIGLCKKLTLQIGEAKSISLLVRSKSNPQIVKKVIWTTKS